MYVIHVHCCQLAHPLLDVLKGGDKQWLVDLLYAFNSGNIAKFESLKPHWSKQVGRGAMEEAGGSRGYGGSRWVEGLWRKGGGGATV